MARRRKKTAEGAKRPTAPAKTTAPGRAKNAGDAGDARPDGLHILWTKLSAAPHALALTGFLALYLSLNAGVVFQGELLLGSGTDVLSAQLPYRTAAIDRLRSGELPLWDPGHFAGAPLLANGQSGATYPPFWLLAGFSAERAVSLSFVFHGALAGLFAYLLVAWLVRREEPDQHLPTWRDVPGPLVAAALVSLGGTVQGHIYAGHSNFLEAFAWTPAVLLTLDRLLAAPSARRTAALAGSVALLALAGHPQVLWLTAFAGLLWTLAVLPRRDLRGLAVRMGWLAVAGAVAFLLAALLLLPMLELAADSHRRLAADPWRFATSYSAPPLALLQLFLPHPFGAPADPSAWWPSFGRWEPQAWVGAGALLLALTALIDRVDRRRVALAAIAALAALLAVGDATPLYGWAAAALPGLDRFRAPARFLLLTGVALPVLAGLGVGALRRAAVPRRLKIGAVAACAAVLLPLVGLQSAATAQDDDSLAAGWVDEHAGRRVRATLESGDTAAARAAVSEPLGESAGAALAGSALAGAVLLLALFMGGAHAATLRNAAAAALALIALWQGTNFAAPWASTAPEDPRPQLSAELIDTIQTTAGHDRVAWWEDRRWNVGMQAEGVRNIGGYDPAVTWRSNDLMNLRAGRGADAGEEWRNRLRMLWPKGRRLRPNRAWNLLAARAVVSRDPRLGTRAPWLRKVAGPAETNSPYAVWENPRAFPRAGLAFSARVIEDESERLLALQEPGWRPDKAVLLEQDPAQPLELPTGRPTADVRWQTDDPEHLVLETSAPAPAYLWLADTWRPGWEATVDGQPSEILIANHGLRAVRVPAGDHTVEMHYRPASVHRGLLLSLAGLLALATLGFGPALLRRLRPARASTAAVEANAEAAG